MVGAHGSTYRLREVSPEMGTKGQCSRTYPKPWRRASNNTQFVFHISSAHLHGLRISDRIRAINDNAALTHGVVVNRSLPRTARGAHDSVMIASGRSAALDGREALLFSTVNNKGLAFALNRGFVDHNFLHIAQ